MGLRRGGRDAENAGSGGGYGRVRDAGEGSLAWTAGLGKWMYRTLNELSAQIELRLADELTADWSDPTVLATVADNPQAYGAFMTPSWISEDGRTVYFVMSQFGPYNTYIMRAALTPL